MLVARDSNRSQSGVTSVGDSFVPKAAAVVIAEVGESIGEICPECHPASWKRGGHTKRKPTASARFSAFPILN
jgi:hypothetical protein